MGERTDTFGITSCGSYLPRWRIARSTITDAIGWARGRVRPGQGTRSFANWDEDCLTMAVEACLAARTAREEAPDRLVLASTTLPFADRSNSGVLREALALNAATRVSDQGGSRRAATTALGEALQTRVPTLLCASECVDARPGSEGETELGHGAAAVQLGFGEVLAECLDFRSQQEDFVDRYRETGQAFEYRLEARWVRDKGIRPSAKALISESLAATGADAADVKWFLTPWAGSVARAVQRDCGLEQARRGEAFEQETGLCGSAHSLLLLTRALSRAGAGDLILLVGFGQGTDVLLLRATGLRASPPAAMPVQREENYARFLGIRGQLNIDGGLRSERDNRSSQSASQRRHAELHGLLGGRCKQCGKLQFPSAALCVHCAARDAQVLEPMSSLPGTVNSFTEDWLAWSPRPPLIFGNVHFPDGANIMMEFTDFEPGELKTGQAVRVAFRIKDRDTKRGFRRYFWKPAPQEQGSG